jgi:hypothetical protein
MSVISAGSPVKGDRTQTARFTRMMKDLDRWPE